MAIPHDSPTMAQLVESVREWIHTDLIPGVDGRLKFHARVAANILAIVERELELGADQATKHRGRLAALGMSNDRELADAIRDGLMDERLDEVREHVRSSVVDKLRVANPGHLLEADRRSD